MAREDVRRGEDLDRRARRPPLTLLLAALLASPLSAASFRWHFEMPGPSPFAYSLLFERSTSGDMTRLLLESGGVRLELSSAQDPSGRDSTESVTDAVSKERFLRRLLLSGYEDVASCGGVRPPDACLVFTGARGSLTTGISAFAGKTGAVLRAQVAALVSRELDGKISAVAPLFPRTMELVAYGDDFLRLVWPDRFPQPSGRYEKGQRKPGCDFDAAFGYPCTEAELRRERSPRK